MEFGKLESIEHIKWDLPPDTDQTVSYLQSLPRSQTQWYLGTPSWGSRTWLGKIYPRQANTSQFLHHYSRAFNTIELNTTHYRIPDEELIKSWREEVPNGFLFCPKFPQLISHRPNGLQDKTTIKTWQNSLEQFGENLGVSWIQLPPYFDYSQRAILHRFLEQWPSELPLALELRHSSWFEKGAILPALVAYLQKRGIGLVITEVAGRQDVLHTSISAPFVLLRFIGNELHPSDFARAENWCERLNAWTRLGLQRVFLFAHQPDDIACPEFTEYLVELFNRRVNANWNDPLSGASKDLLI